MHASNSKNYILQQKLDSLLEAVRNGHPPENVDDTDIRTDAPETNRVEIEGAELGTIHLVSMETGEGVSVKVLAKPQPKGITQEWKQNRKAALVDDITGLYLEGEAPAAIADFLGIPKGFVKAVIEAHPF